MQRNYDMPRRGLDVLRALVARGFTDADYKRLRKDNRYSIASAMRYFAEKQYCYDPGTNSTLISRLEQALRERG